MKINDAFNVYLSRYRSNTPGIHRMGNFGHVFPKFQQGGPTHLKELHMSLRRGHRAGHRAARDVPGFEAVLREDARRVVGALSGATYGQDLAVQGELAAAGAELG